MLKDVGYTYKTQAYMLGLLGIVSIINVILKWDPHDTNIQILAIISSFFIIVMAVMLYRPSDNFEKIDDTEGRDIEELMTGINDLMQAFQVIIILVILMMLIGLIVVIIE